MENENKKPISLSWHTPVLGGDCPHCGEWSDYQSQNEGDDGWNFKPCESQDKEATGYGTKWAKIYTCPECKKEVEIETVEW